MRKILVNPIVLLLLAGVVIGALFAGSTRDVILRDELKTRAQLENERYEDDSTFRRERAEIALEQWEKEQEATYWPKVIWAWAKRVAPAMFLLGGAMVVILYGMRRAITIFPDKRGLFPLLLGRVGGTWTVLDPNTSFVVTAQKNLGGGAQIGGALPPGVTPEMAGEIMARFQSVQAVAASASAGQPDSLSSALIGAIATRRLGPPLPTVIESPYTASHVERVLIESGQLTDGEP